MPDNRKLEKTSLPGVYRRHTGTCKGDGRCRCQYVVRWKERGQARKQTFARFDEAKLFKASLDSGTTTRRPLASTTLGDYHEPWLKGYRGRTARGLEDSTRREYEISFRLHIVPLPIAGLKMREVGAPDVRDWLAELEERGCSPTTIRKAKAALSVMLASAVEDGDLGSNPAAGVRYVPSPRARRAHPRQVHRKLTAADVTAILGAMEDHWRAFFMLLVQSGVRISELLGLTWRHVQRRRRPAHPHSRAVLPRAAQAAQDRREHGPRSAVADDGCMARGAATCGRRPGRARVPIRDRDAADVLQRLQPGAEAGAARLWDREEPRNRGRALMGL